MFKNVASLAMSTLFIYHLSLYVFILTEVEGLLLRYPYPVLIRMSEIRQNIGRLPTAK
jgi:hypothetical protein